MPALQHLGEGGGWVGADVDLQAAGADTVARHLDAEKALLAPASACRTAPGGRGSACSEAAGD